jgi:hypothetical protein
MQAETDHSSTRKKDWSPAPTVNEVPAKKNDQFVVSHAA